MHTNFAIYIKNQWSLAIAHEYILVQKYYIYIYIYIYIYNYSYLKIYSILTKIASNMKCISVQVLITDKLSGTGV